MLNWKDNPKNLLCHRSFHKSAILDNTMDYKDLTKPLQFLQFKDRTFTDAVIKLARAIRFLSPRSSKAMIWAVTHNKYTVDKCRAYKSPSYQFWACYESYIDDYSWNNSCIAFCPSKGLIWIRAAVPNTTPGVSYKVYLWKDNKLVRIPSDRDLEIFEKCMKDTKEPHTVITGDTLFPVLYDNNLHAEVPL